MNGKSNMYHADLYACHIEQELAGLVDQPEPTQEVIDQAVLSQDHNPREGAHEDAGPEWHQDQRHQHVAGACRRRRHEVGHRIAEDQREKCCQEADLEGVRESLEIGRLVEQFTVEFQRELLVEKAPHPKARQRVDVYKKVEDQGRQDEQALARAPEPRPPRSDGPAPLLRHRSFLLS